MANHLKDPALRMLPFAVSLDRARRDKFVAIGGSAWLRHTLDRIPDVAPAKKTAKPARRKA